MTQKPKLYEIYQQRRAELIQLTQRQHELVQALGVDAVQGDGTKLGDILSGLINRLRTEKLQVLVIGRFNAGKSTFINALLGKPILPASPAPTTGVLCVIKFAAENEKKAILYPKKGMGKDGDNAPMEISISNLQEELGKYVKIDHFGDIQHTSRYQKLELYWPLPLLQYGIELIDSVGLDDPDARDEITLDYARSADVMLYCMKSQDAYSKKDKQTFSLLESLGYESIFFIISYYDHIRNSAALGEMSEENFRDFMKKSLSSWTELGEKGIHYVDSQTALSGHIQQNDEKIASSGIREVENALEIFLVEEKGRAKLLTTLRSLNSTNRSIRQIILARRAMWQTSKEELERRYRNADQPLKNLETKRQLIVGSVGQRISDITRDAYDLADSFFMSLPDKIVVWASDYEIESSVGLIPRKSTLEPVIKEVVEHIKICIEKEIADWNNNELTKMIESRMEEIQEYLENDARDFVKEVDRLRVQISIGDEIDHDALAKQEEPSMWGRLIAGGFGVVTGNFALGGLGAVLGIKAMLHTLMYQLIGAVMISIFSILNPAAIVVVIIAATAAGGIHTIFSLKTKIKNIIGEKFAEQIAKKQKELSRNVENKVKEELNKIKSALDNGLAGEINSVRGEVEKIIGQKNKDMTSAEQEINMLNMLEKENIAHEEDIAKLIFEAGISVK